MSPNFTARSLVGMTMGTRKRAVLTEMDRKDHPENGQRLDYWEVRAQYRIGQKLRPCAGCEECRGYDDGIGIIHCDGSGVLPARKEKP